VPLAAGFVQSLPKLSTFNESLFVVYAGYQDYFFSLYDGSLTIKQTKKIIPDVVKAIEDHIVVSSRLLLHRLPFCACSFHFPASNFLLHLIISKLVD
jgi:hypothetical protein